MNKNRRRRPGRRSQKRRRQVGPRPPSIVIDIPEPERQEPEQRKNCFKLFIIVINWISLSKPYEFLFKDTNSILKYGSMFAKCIIVDSLYRFVIHIYKNISKPKNLFSIKSWYYYFYCFISVSALTLADMSVNSIKKHFDDSLEKMENRMNERMDERMEIMDERMERMDERMEIIETSMANMQQMQQTMVTTTNRILSLLERREI